MTSPTFALALHLPLAMPVAAPFATAGLAAGVDEPSVCVEQVARGCFHDDQHEHEWKLAGESFTWGDRKLARSDVAALKKTIVEARHEVPELLSEVGITEESLAAHRGEILAAVMPAAWKRDAKAAAEKLPPELDPLLDWERVAPLLRRELLGQARISTEERLVRITFAGDGATVIVESRSLVPWMLPWKVTVDGQEWTSEDLAVPRAVLKLLDPKGPCAALVDGSSYWRDRIWTDDCWRRYLGRELDRALAERVYTRLAGWERASRQFAVRNVMTGNINLQPESMYFELDAKGPVVVDRARWHDLLVGGKPSRSWDDFLELHEHAEACVEPQRWLLDWKLCSPRRHVELEAAGTSGMAERMVDALVLPAWKDAGFAGRPGFELFLREDQDWVGTIYLASGEAGALITSARRIVAPARDAASGTEAPAPQPSKDKPAKHWLDDLDFSFHPNGSPPTYGRVDGDGRVEVRTMERASGRRK